MKAACEWCTCRQDQMRYLVHTYLTLLLLLHCRHTLLALPQPDRYVHCANGHGRSATYCAVVMMYRGQARGWRHAFTVMKAKRPWINIQRPQELAMDRIEGILRQHGALPQHQQPPHHLGAGAGTGAGGAGTGAGTAVAPVVELEMQLLDGHGAGASASTAAATEATTAARTGTGTSPAS